MGGWMLNSQQVALAASATSASLTLALAFFIARDLQQRRRTKRQRRPVLVDAELSALPKSEVPERLRPEFYFDFEAHPFEHADLLRNAHNLVEVLERIHKYALDWLAQNTRRGVQVPSMPDSCKLVGGVTPVFGEDWSSFTTFTPDVLIGPLVSAAPGSQETTLQHVLHVGPGARVLGGTFDLRGGGVFLGEGVVVEPGAHISGPAIIGRRTTLRCGTYIRGDIVVGNDVVLRGELKNAIIMDHAELAHPSYAGDSIIGHKGHLGCQAVTANLGLFHAQLSVVLPENEHSDECLAKGVRYRLGRRKLGVVLGDSSQLGCNTVTDPATFVGPRTHVYPLTRLCSGCYGPDEIVKNNPIERGVVTRELMRPQANS